MSHQCWYKDQLHSTREENGKLRSLLWKIAHSTRRFSLDDNGDPMFMIVVEEGQSTLDAIDEAIGYDEMGQ